MLLFPFSLRRENQLVVVSSIFVNHEECDDVTFSCQKILLPTFRRLVVKNPFEITNLFVDSPNKTHPVVRLG